MKKLNLNKIIKIYENEFITIHVHKNSLTGKQTYYLIDGNDKTYYLYKFDNLEVQNVINSIKEIEIEYESEFYFGSFTNLLKPFIVV